MKEESDKNIVVPSEIQNPAVVPAIIKTGTMARKTKAAQNTLPYLMITDFLLTVTVSLLRKFRLYTKCWGKERAYKINLKNFQKSRAYFPKIR